MVDLQAKPYFLSEEQEAWVKRTIDSMSLEEKIGQLFTIMTYLPGVREETGLLPPGRFALAAQDGRGNLRTESSLSKAQPDPAADCGQL